MSASAVMAPPAPAPTPRFAAAAGAPHPSTPRRPSPWHDIAPLVPSPPVALPRRGSAPALAPPQYSLTPSHSTPHSPPTLPSAPAAPPQPTPIPHAASSPPIPSTGSTSGLTPYDSDDSAPASVTSSQALRDWERLIAAPDNDITRHALIPLPSSAEGSPQLGPAAAAAGAGAALPKLAAERDKEGHIEYKLKLIEPSPERFERLVTQMMWRLKQGRNEAIYELGLADDGTVIGLTRAEMDASLATLERMASEVGATVLVLKEIVLAAPPEGADSSTAAARRPDLDEHGRPRKGTRGLNGVGAETKSRRERLRARREAEAAAAAAAGLGPEPLAPRRGARSIIFDQAVGSDSDDDARDIASHEADADVDDDGAQFALDMDDDAGAVPRSTSRTRSVTFPAAGAAGTPDAEAEARAEAKRRKSAARREARRLDLLRGDGTAYLPYAERSRSPVAEFIGHAPAIATHMRHMLPHQPTRPSTLRLGTVPRAEGASGTTSPTDAGATPDDAFLDGLALPLDSLSLSFADVHSASTSPTQPSILAAAGSGTFAISASSPGTPATHTLAPLDTSPPGEELICVEALVVRKPHGDEWEYGGHDDGWGFGAPGDDEDDDGGVGGAGEMREDDPWGFEDDDG